MKYAINFTVHQVEKIDLKYFALYNLNQSKNGNKVHTKTLKIERRETIFIFNYTQNSSVEKQSTNVEDIKINLGILLNNKQTEIEGLII